MRNASTRQALATLLVVSLLSAQAAPALAQTDDDRAGARAAATAAATAMQQEKWEEAIDLFTRAESLVHAPPHLLYIARAYAKQGKLVRARENYLKVMREELAATAPRAFVDAQASANAEGSALEARLPTVKVVVEGDNTEGSVVTMDGVPVASALTGIPHPIDPGEHKFQARTKAWSSEVVTMTFAEGSRETLTLALRLTLKQESTPGPVVAGTTAPASPEVATTAASNPNSPLRLGAYIGLGVGVVGIALGTVFLAQNRSKRNEADTLCPNGVCAPSARTQIRTLDSDADGAGTKAWIGYGVGVVGLGAGATLFVLSMRAKKKETATTGLTVQPWFGLASAGMSGTF